MSFIESEIAAQPESWRRAAALLPTVAHLLPTPGQTVAVVGCGTSWFMAESYARLREAAGHGRTDAFTATEYPQRRSYDRVIAITRSGTTTETIDALARIEPVRSVAITADVETPTAQAAGSVIDLGFADERSVVQTLFATTTLALLRAHLATDVVALADSAEKVLLEPLDDAWLSADQFTFLGTGWAHGIAREAALKLRETAQAWTESYPSPEYRHGPISVAAPGRVVWHFGGRDATLAEDVAVTGADFVANEADAQVDLILVQRLAVERARLQGLDPDHPRHLTRSVVLTPRSAGV